MSTVMLVWGLIFAIVLFGIASYFEGEGNNWMLVISMLLAMASFIVALIGTFQLMTGA